MKRELLRVSVAFTLLVVLLDGNVCRSAEPSGSAETTASSKALGGLSIGTRITHFSTFAVTICHAVRNVSGTAATSSNGSSPGYGSMLAAGTLMRSMYPPFVLSPRM